MANVQDKKLNVKLVVSPVTDVLIGLRTLVENCKPEKEKKHKYANPEGEEFASRVRASLRPRLLSNLDRFFDLECYPGLGLLSLLGNDYALEVPAFLQALNHMPSEELATALLSFGRIFRGNLPFERNIEELQSDRELLTEYIEKNMTVPTEKVGRLADIIINLPQAREDLSELIEHFWYVVMASEVEKRAQQQQQTAEQCRVRLNEIGPQRMVIGLTNLQMSSRGGEYEEAVLAPNSFAFNGAIVATENADQSCLIVTFGADHEILRSPRPEPTEDGPLTAEKLAELYKTLGDEMRLNIVRALIERPHYGQELAEMFGISNATVFYHLSLLSKKKIVHLERIEHRVYYVLDTERLRAMLSQGTTFLLG